MKITYLFSILIASSFISSAATINFANWDSNQGAISGYTVTLDQTGTSLLHNFTFTGDIDGCAAAGVVGAANDTFSFTVVDTFYTGSTFSGDNTTSGSLTLGTVTNNDVETSTSALHFGVNTYTSATNGYLNNGMTTELSLTNMVYSRGEAGVSEAASFNGFSAFQIFKSGVTAEAFIGEDGNTSGTSITPATNGQTYNFAAPVQTFTFTQTANTGTDRLRIRDLDFSFTVADSHDPIPEPSASLLAVIGSLSLLTRRRR